MQEKIDRGLSPAWMDPQRVGGFLRQLEPEARAEKPPALATVPSGL